MRRPLPYECAWLSLLVTYHLMCIFQILENAHKNLEESITIREIDEKKEEVQEVFSLILNIQKLIITVDYL